MNTSKDISTVIFETLKEKILNVEYPPGTPLSEAIIGEMFHASRTPCRTAMQRLSDLGLIDILPYQNSRVSKIDLSQVEQLIYARSAIEDRLIQDFIRKDDLFLIEDVESYVRKQQILMDKGNFSAGEFYDLDAGMHRIWYSSQNKLSLWEYFQNSIHYTRVRMLDIKEIKDFEAIVDEHRRILECIRTQNTDMIYFLTKKHFSSGLIRLEGRINGDLSGYFA